MKKILKLLILLMSLALIVGALSVVAFAKDGEDDTVIVTGDIEFEGAFDEALTEIIDNGDGEYTITLQGNCSSEGVVLDDLVDAREVTIDLNGYTLNLEDATTAFEVKAFNVLNVTGSGEIIFGSQIVSTTDDCDSVINFVGTGAGIKMTSTTDTINVITAKGTSEINFKNVNIEVAAEKVIDGTKYSPATSVILAFGETKVTFDNSRFVYTMDVSMAEGFDPSSLTGDQKYQNFELFTSFFAQLKANSQLVLNNTYVKTPTSGIKFVDAAGAAYEGLEENNVYSLVMNDSTLLCVNDSAVTAGFNKAMNCSTGFMRLQLFHLKDGMSESTGDIYAKGSYLGAAHRLISSKPGTYAVEDPARMVFDEGTTVEYVLQAYNLAGISSGNNGEGIIDSGAAFITFKKGSAFINQKSIHCAGSGNGKETNVKDSAGNFTIQFEIGARLQGSGLGNTGKPDGSSFVAEPTTNLKAPYVLTADGTGATASRFNNGGYSVVRWGGLGNVDMGSYAGESGVHKLTQPTVAEIVATEGYDPATRTVTVGDTTFTVAEDGKSYTYTNSGYVSLNWGGQYNWRSDPNGVVVFSFKIMPDAENPFLINGNFFQHGKYSSGGTLNKHLYMMFGKSEFTNKLIPGQWNEISFVVDNKTGNYYKMLNGAIDSITTGHAGMIVGLEGMYDDIRIESGNDSAGWQSQVIGEMGGTMYISASQLIVYKTQNEGEFNPADYVPYSSAEYVAPYASKASYADITVGNAAFDNINDALGYANTIGSFVNLNGDVTDASVYNSGVVRSNGYTFTYQTTADVKVEDGNYTFTSKESVNASWYFGSAEDPATDEGNIFSMPVAIGGNLFMPNTDLTVKNFIRDEDGIYSLAGWATTYVRPQNYANGAAYLEAVKGLNVITNFATVTAGEEDMSFYPVYAFEKYLYKTVAGDGVVFYGTKNDDFTEAFARARSEGKITLLGNVVVTKTLNSYAMGDTNNPSKDSFHRTGRQIDLNGYNLHVAIPGDATWIPMAGGNVTITSSRPGASITQLDKSGGAPIFSARSNGGRLTINDPNHYITISANCIAASDRWDNGTSRTGTVKIEGGIFIFSSQLQSRGFLFADTFDGTQAITATGSIFIQAAGTKAPLICARNGHVQTYNNCTFINLSTNNLIYQVQMIAGKGVSTINFNNCTFSNYNLAVVQNCNVSGNTVATGFGGAKIPEDMVVAYTNANMALPAILGESYVVLNEKGETMTTLTAADLNAKYGLVAKADATLYTWNGLNDTTYAAYVAGGADAADLNSLALGSVTNAKDLNAIKVAITGWTLDGTTFKPNVEAAGLSGFGALANVKLEEGFVLGILVTPENYEFLSEESKALFTKVTLENVDYYVASADRNVNRAFTDFTVEVTVEEEGYAYTTSYTVSVMDYLNMVFAAEARVEMDKIASYIVSYLNNAYAYFTDTDATEDDLAALATLAAAVEANKAPEDVTRPEAPEAIDANGNLEIKLDLTATPAFVITSQVAGTVTFNGETTDLVAGVPVRLEASVLDFDNALTFALEGDVTGNYCLANYAATIAAATEIEGLDEAGLAALKALVASFYDYVIYAENFR